MATIWKFAVQANSTYHQQLPAGSRVLSVQVQGNGPQMWVLVPDENAPREIRTFSVFGTGHTLPATSMKFIGTFQLECGSLVFHLFEHI